MIDQSQEPKSNDAAAQPVASRGTSESGGISAIKLIIGCIGGLMVVLVAGFVGALILALASPGAAGGVQIVRDFFVIMLALEGILVGAALIILVLQLARLTNLLQNEIKPILQQTNDTVKTVRGTATFMSRHVADPVIRTGGFLSWLLAILRELLGVRRAVRAKGGGRTAAVPEEGE